MLRTKDSSLFLFLRSHWAKTKAINNFKGALSQQFYCFPAKTIQKSFFLTFTRAKIIALKFRTKISINLLKEEKSMVHFWLCLKNGLENFEQLRLKFSKCNPSPSLPPATTESSKKSQCSYLVYSKQTSSLFLSFYWCEDIFQHSKVGKMARQSHPLAFIKKQGLIKKKRLFKTFNYKKLRKNFP